ncbi:hypothetical protein [Phaffia rhodozyma]|uniref:Allergen n=1 Tax=Phaffia rhodozyma TaxID=264483 RepID=A0A0F7SHC9_PHARH|nr:hypothetical protein [Phaffia rhodozyma]
MDHVKNFLSSSNKETSTEVCSEIGPEVVQETINKHVHVESATAVDRERHIHHHQHRVQPIAATEHLAEQHITQVAPEVTRERVEKLSAEKEALLAQQHGAIQNTREHGATIQTQENLGVTASEHVHHHVHEHITPVIQKDVHQHEVIHNVQLVHEKTQAGDAVHNHGDTQHSHHFYSGLPKVESGHGAAGVPTDASAIHAHKSHTDIEGHQHKTSVGEKAANAVEQRSDRV